MSTTGSGSGGERPLAGGAARGIALLVVAVLLGFLLLRAAFDGGGGGSASGDDVDRTTTTAEPDTTDTTEAPTTTLAEPRPPNEVKVLVANGSGTQGAAARTGDALTALGYTVVGATNAPANVATTSIYYAQGYNADALAIATALGAPEGAVSLMPNPPPIPDLAGANVLIVLGPDLATPA
ncbi:MAG: LytR C-terminal domain-containing protein [Acidimicrobiales bacterium]|nr:LytR C-terminal domain-containing protein [Acidimicrobiales bacterium]